MVSNFNMDALHIMKEHFYSKFTEELHDKGKNCVFMTKERHMMILNKVREATNNQTEKTPRDH
jgi:hypothetical protein